MAASAEPAAPPATEPPTCANPNVDAATLDAVAPDTPPIAAQQGISGDVTVLVSLDAQSHVTGARIMRSPSALLNDAALRAARASTFRTEIRDCRPVAADYAFIVEFTTQ
jgi:TonB family protein